jgi:hypothetical protein
MVQIILIGIGAGLAAALLFSALGGTFLSFPLFALTGLPIGIVSLGWTPIAGAIAALVGAAAVFFFLSPLASAMFLLLFALPLVWLARLAGLSRTSGESVDWFPLGRILVHAAIAVAIGLTACGFLIGFNPKILTAMMLDEIALWIAAVPDNGRQPTQEEIETVVRFYVAMIPYLTATMMVIVIVFDLWLAGIVARTSGRLARPRERLWTVTLSLGTAGTFIVALAASFLSFPLGSIAAVVAGAFGCALALLGLAVLHAVTFGSQARTAMLTITYVLATLLFPLFAAIGLGETFLNLRARRFGGAPPPV